MNFVPQTTLDKMEKAIENIEGMLKDKKQWLEEAESDLKLSKVELVKSFDHEQTLSEKLKKQQELNYQLNIDSELRSEKELIDSIVKCEDGSLMYVDACNNKGDIEAYRLNDNVPVLSYKLCKTDISFLSQDTSIDFNQKHSLDMKDIKEKLETISSDIVSQIGEFKNLLESKNLIKEVKSNSTQGQKLSKGLDFSIK